MPEKLDAIVLAGTHGMEPFEVDGKKIYKQYIEICGKTIVARVVDTVLSAKLINRVYVVGNTGELKNYLRDRLGDRCILVEQGDNIVDNIVDTFVRRILYDEITGWKSDRLRELVDSYRHVIERRVFTIAADVLFPSAPHIDSMISRCAVDSDVEFGVTTKQAFDEFIAKHDLNDYDENLFKTCFTPVAGESVRHNNMSITKPLKMSAALYTFCQELYENRVFVDETGNLRRQTWSAFHKSLWKYVRGSSNRNLFKMMRIYRGFANIVFEGLVIYRAMKRNKGSWFASVRDIEKAVSWFCDCTVRCNITNSPSVIDLDRAEAYNYFRDKGVFDKLYS